MAGDELVLEDHIPQLVVAIHSALADAAKTTAEAIAQGYRDNAPKATGFMASSAYTVTSSSSTYGSGVVGDGELEPSVDAPSSDQEAIAAVAAGYAGYVEYGTAYAAAQPAFAPAIDAAVKALGDALANVEATIAPEGIKG